MKTILTIILGVTCLCLSAQPQEGKQVMLIGEMDNQYEQMVAECNTLLLTVSDNSMTVAFDHWTTMLQDMETAAAEKGIDIKGSKLWMNMFWNEDGSIRNIYYYPKPTSKNMDFDQLTDFLNDFAATYVFPVTHSSCYSHYGSAAFPVRRKLNTDVK